VSAQGQVTTDPPVAFASIVDAIDARVAGLPASPALIWRDGAVTYAELGAMVRDAQVALLGLDVPAGVPVALVARKSPRAIAFILACLATRRPLVLPPVDLGRAALDAVIARSGAGHIVATGDGEGLLVTKTGAATPPREQRTASAAPPAAALMLTTSGSTGLSKIVPITREAIDRFASWAGPHFGIGARTPVLNCAPLNFDLCLLDVWTSLAWGASVVLVDQNEATHASGLLELLQTHNVAVVQAVPLFYRLVIEAARERPCRVRSVEHLIVTGETMRPAGLEALSEIFDRAVLHNVYGCTETNDSFTGEIDLAEVRRRGIVPIGRPLPGVHARLVAPDGTTVTGEGIGELWVSTPFQTPGYLDPALNAGRFVADVDEDAPERAFFRSGDLIRRHPDGALTVEGRDDFQVKVRGVRVNPHEVEAVLQEHPDVVEAAVLAVGDGASGTQLHAVVHRRADALLSGLVLRGHCAAWLPLAAIPSRMSVVDLSLPRTSTGKLDRARCHELAEIRPSRPSRPLTVLTPATAR